MNMSAALPIDAQRDAILKAFAVGPVLITSPTGSGKSTQVPRWVPGRVFVVEPRRVACQRLARRVADLEGEALGKGVGYHVRDDRRESDATRISFVTPGIALRRFDELLQADAVLLDEFHERQLELDLLLALLHEQRAAGYAVMSATLSVKRLSEHLDAAHIHAAGRSFPVEISHHAAGVMLPQALGLADRAVAALELAIEGSADTEGDVLLFLPGKREIRELEARLEQRSDIEVLSLHGGLSLEQQARVFDPAPKRKVVLTTNVAETSLTVPGVRIVIDSGLVRRTTYHRGRGHLVLSPVALDSAEQRAGRSGRTSAGRCIRLWDARAVLEASTPPEVHRESLVPLLLAAAAQGKDVRTLSFFDAPKTHAVEDASKELLALGALDEDGAITSTGRALFGFPLDAALGRILVEARGTDVEDTVVDLVAALSVDRPLFTGSPRLDVNEDPRATGCDVKATLRAMADEGARAYVQRQTLDAVLIARRRLRLALGLDPRTPPQKRYDADALARVLISADPRMAHVARTRKQRRHFAAGGVELEEGRDSALSVAQKVEACIVLAERALVDARGERRRILTIGMPVRLALLHSAGLGEDRVADAYLERGKIRVRIERVLAQKVLGTREETPRGEAAREAIARLFVQGRIHRGAIDEAKLRHSALSLASQLAGTPRGKEMGLEGMESAPPPLENWLRLRLEELGVESGDDLALLTSEDLLPDELPFHVRGTLDKEFPLRVDLGDSLYEAVYDLRLKQVQLILRKGNRSKPPPASFLPRFPGLKVFIEAGRTMHRVR